MNPATPTVDLTGHWVSGATPPVVQMRLSLHVMLGGISGTGVGFGWPGHSRDSISVTGSIRGDDIHFELETTKFGLHQTASYAGHLVAADEFQVSCAAPNAPCGPIYFHRR